MNKNYSSKGVQQRKKINDLAMTTVVNYIRDNYKLKTLVIQLGLWNGGPTTIKCPLHADSRPSFSMNFERNIYKCFSCGSQGSYLDLLHDYRTKVKSESISRASIVEELLKDDSEMQQITGFSSVFEMKEQLKDVEETLRDFGYTPKKVEVMTVRRLLRETKNDPVKLCAMIADLEKGFSDNELLDKYYYDRVVAETNETEKGEVIRDTIVKALGEVSDDDILDVDFSNLFG